MKYDKTGGFSSLSEFLSRVRQVCDGEIRGDTRLKTTGHYAEGNDSEGGFLVPDEWASGIYEAAALEGAIVRPRARVIPTTSDSLNVRTLIDTDRSSNTFGGITFTWVAEGGNLATGISRPAHGLVSLTPHKLVGSTWVSNELESDHAAFGAYMNAAFGAALRYVEDDYFINGTGSGQIQGILNAPATISVGRTQSGLVTYDDLTNMVKRLLPASWGTAVWLVNPDVVGQWLSADAIESGASVQDALDLNTRKLMGFPFIVTSTCQSLGTSGDVLLADFRHYVIADRGLEISGSRHVNASSTGFITGETFWRIVLRIDGQPLLTDAITAKRGANTLSPFIALGDHVS